MPSPRCSQLFNPESLAPNLYEHFGACTKWGCDMVRLQCLHWTSDHTCSPRTGWVGGHEQQMQSSHIPP